MSRRGEASRAVAVEAAVATYVADHGLLPSGGRVLLLLSGGPDSMALLALVRHCDRRLGLGLRLAALHVDYGLRGEASDRDRRIVERACAAAGVPLEVLCPRPPLSPPDFQEKARRLRLDAARRLVDVGAVELVATGHNLDDQAETVVYRLAKYAAPSALTGMAPRAGHLVRPLLGIRAADLRDYCSARGIEYGEDATNRQEVYARNVVRHAILPQMQRLNPRVVESLAAAAEVARDQQVLLDGLVDEAWEQVAAADGSSIDVAGLRALPAAVRPLVLRRLVNRAAGSGALIERRVTGELLSLAGSASGYGRMRLRGGWEAVLERGRLSLREAAAPHRCDPIRCPVPAPGEGPAAVGFCGRRLLLWQERGALPVPPRAGAQLGVAAPLRDVVLRHPVVGDTWVPLGLGAETSVRRFLGGQRVARRDRDRALLVEVRGAVAWVEVPGLARDAAGAAPPGGRRPSPGPLHGRVAESFRVTQSTAFTVCVQEQGR